MTYGCLYLGKLLSAPASLNGRSSRRWAHWGPLSTYGPKVRVKIGARVAESQISAAGKVSSRHFTGRSRRAARRGGTRRVAEGGWGLGAALDERCGPEGWPTRPVRDSAPLKNGGRWTRVGTDLDAGPAPLGAADKTAGRGVRSKPSSAAVTGPRVLLVYAEHFSCRTGAWAGCSDRRPARTDARVATGSRCEP